jgi:signal peptidase I
VPGRSYRAGEVVARGHVDTGDQVFVDKVGYHFLPPRRAQVFVFKTSGIQRIERRPDHDPRLGSQHYIKRLAACPGDELRIDPPDLYINGTRAAEPGFVRVMAARDGYRGYSNGSGGGGRFDILGEPRTSFTVPPRSYFALGDNSYHSSDSRDFGPVPERNLVGRGIFVYWPFNRHWGAIR